MRLDKPTLLFTLVAVLMAAPVFAADAVDTDASKGSAKDAHHSAMTDGTKAHDTGMKSHRDPMKQDRTTVSGADAMKSADEQYVVQKGDTLTTIAKKKLGSADKWQEIAHANDIDDPDALRVGQKLSIPVSKNVDAKNADAKNVKNADGSQRSKL